MGLHEAGDAHQRAKESSWDSGAGKRCETGPLWLWQHILHIHNTVLLLKPSDFSYIVPDLCSIMCWSIHGKYL